MAVKRAWRLTVDGIGYDIAVNESPWTGKLAITINDRPADVIARRQRGRRTTFMVGAHPATVLKIVYGRRRFFDLVVDGRSVTTGAQPRPPENPDESLGSSLLLLVACLGIAAAVFWAAGLGELRLALEGAVATGIVHGGRVSHGRSDSYYLQYTFVASPSGDIRNAEGQVSYDTYTHAHLNDRITVLYVPADPSIQRPAAFDERWAIEGLIGGFLVGAAFSGNLAWRAYQGRLMRQALRRAAVMPATATVEKIAKPWGGFQIITYRYEDALGRTRTGSSGRLYPEEAAGYPVGSQAMIAYDTSDPGLSMWIGQRDPNATVWVEQA